MSNNWPYRGEEPVETNTSDNSPELKRESDLIGDDERVPVVTQKT